MTFELQQAAGPKGAAMAAGALAFNISVLALMQRDVAGNAFVRLPFWPAFFPASKPRDAATVKTPDGSIVAGYVEDVSGNLRVVQVDDGKVYLQEQCCFGWLAVDIDGAPACCDKTAWQKQHWQAFHKQARENTDLMKNLNLPGFRADFLNHCLADIRELVVEQVRNPMDFAGHLGVYPTTDGGAFLSAGRVVST